MPAINSRCRQWHKPSFLLLDSFRPVFRQVLKSCTFLFFMLSGLLKPHNHPSLIPLISENQPFPAYSLLSFRECSIFSHILPHNNTKRYIFVIKWNILGEIREIKRECTTTLSKVHNQDKPFPTLLYGTYLLRRNWHQIFSLLHIPSVFPFLSSDASQRFSSLLHLMQLPS